MDPIADMLTSIVNANRVKKSALIPLSKLKINILQILKAEGLVKDFEIAKDVPGRIIVHSAGSSIEQIKRISKPGRRLYIRAKQIRPKSGVLQVISTPAGVLTAVQARKKHLGGEILFEVRQ